MNQGRQVESELSLVGNSLTGPLPNIFYSFYFDAATTLTYFSAKDNHFRCSPDHENEYFDDWAHNLNEDVGMCEPVASPSDVVLPEVPRAGDEITIEGESFAATTEITCKFTYADATSAVVPAFFYSATEVRCTLPTTAPVGDCAVAVANYGADYSSRLTLAGAYEPPVFTIHGPESKKKNDDETTVVLVGVIVGALGLAAAVTASCLYLVAREKAGKPLFMPLPSSSPLHPQDVVHTSEIDMVDRTRAQPQDAVALRNDDDDEKARMSTIPL